MNFHIGSQNYPIQKSHRSLYFYSRFKKVVTLKKGGNASQISADG
jgi:hypothetical protein